jgi:type I restriction enzyme, S subunit
MAETLRLGDHCDKIGSGATPRGGKGTYSDDGPIALIRSQNVYNDGFSTGGLAYISHEQAAQLLNVEVKEGDVLLNITGDSVARTCEVDKAVMPARVNQHVAIIRPVPDRIYARFLRYFLVTPSMQAHMLGLAAAGATRNALTKSMIEGFRIPAWPVRSQRSIADVLGALDDKIELNRRTNKTLEAMARAIFKDWFIDFGPTRAKQEGHAPYLAPDIWSLFPDRLDDDGKPEGWDSGSLDDVAHLNPESWSRANYPARVKYVDLSNTKWGTIEAVASYLSEAAPSRAQRILRPGDTIVGTVRPGNGSYAYVSTDGLTGSTGFAVLRPKQSIFREVVHLASTSEENIDRLAHLADGGAYPAVRPELVLATELVSIPDKLTAKFSSSTSTLIDRAEANKREMEALAATRDLLLPKLMSGEVRVKDTDTIIAEAT